MVEQDFDGAGWALARSKFGLIAPAVNGTYPDKNKTAYFKRMEGTPVTFEDGQVRYIKASTMAEWLRKYEQGGLSALLPHRRSDAGSYRRLDDEVACSIRSMHERFPKMPATSIYEALVGNGTITRTDVSLSTVQRFCRRVFVPSPDEVKERRAFEAEFVNGIWQADTLYGPFVNVEGKRSRAFLQTIVDDKSRLIVGSRFTLNDDTASFQGLLKHAICAFGIPAKLFVDNGSAYRNTQLSTICAKVGIVVAHAPVRDGAAKGKIERLNRTIRTKFLSTMADDCNMSLDELNAKLAEWVVDYNATVHSSTNRTPIDIYGEAAASVRPIDKTKVDDLFLNSLTRKVNNDNTVRLEKVSYDVPMGHVGERVLVLFEPGCTGRVLVQFTGCEPQRIQPTDKIGNTRRRRSNTRYKVDWAQATNKEEN